MRLSKGPELERKYRHGMPPVSPYVVGEDSLNLARLGDGQDLHGYGSSIHDPTRALYTELTRPKSTKYAIGARSLSCY